MAPGSAGCKKTPERERQREREREKKKKEEWVTSPPPGLNKHEAISRGSHWGVYALDMERKEIEKHFFFPLLKMRQYHCIGRASENNS